MTKEQQDLVLNNVKLVTFLVIRYYPNSDYDEYIGIGNLGLVKAAVTFDPSRGFKFATYAAKIIHNQLGMHYNAETGRKRKYQPRIVSLQDVIAEDARIKTIEDIIGYEDQYNFLIQQDEERCLQLLDKLIYSAFKYHKVPVAQQRLFYQYFMDVFEGRPAMRQSDMAEQLGIAQSYVSRRLRLVKKRVQVLYERGVS